jgi:predicted Zn-dependent protease
MNRNTVLKFRVNEEECAEIKRKAEAAGMNLSKYLRTSAVNEQIALYDTADVYGLRSEIKRIGNNINQIAAAVNSNGSVFENDIKDIKKAFKTLTDRLENHLKPLSYKVL